MDPNIKEIDGNIINDPQSETDEYYEKVWKELSKLFIQIEGKGVEVRDASYGRGRSEYCRGKDFLHVVTQNLEWVCSEIEKITGSKINPKSSSAFQLIYEEFNSREMLKKAQKHEDDSRIKWPKRLVAFDEGCCPGHENKSHGHQPNKPTPENMILFDESLCYLVEIERSKKMSYMWLGVLVIVVLAFCMFPVWPLELKIGVWWVSYILLLVMLGLIAVRLAIFLFFYTVGIDVWLFPNLFDEKLGVIDSFKPFLTFTKRQETLLTILFRVAISLTVAYGAYHVYTEPQSVNDLYEHVWEVGNDVFGWGTEKLINYHNGTQISLADKHKNIFEEEDEF
jgi:translocation protein SEC62